jgi:hypothetical protein
MKTLNQFGYKSYPPLLTFILNGNFTIILFYKFKNTRSNRLHEDLIPLGIRFERVFYYNNIR